MWRSNQHSWNFGKINIHQFIKNTMYTYIQETNVQNMYNFVQSPLDFRISIRDWQGDIWFGLSWTDWASFRHAQWMAFHYLVSLLKKKEAQSVQLSPNRMSDCQFLASLNAKAQWSATKILIKIHTLSLDSAILIFTVKDRNKESMVYIIIISRAKDTCCRWNQYFI